MIDELAAASKQTGLELITLSNTVAGTLQTWGDTLDQVPDSITATFTAGFISKPSVPTELEMVIDVQTPPDGAAVLRTWAIQTKMGHNKKEYFNSMQLTFEIDDQQAHDLVAKGKAITREDIRLLLQKQSSRLARITVCKESGDDKATQTSDERYDFTIAELNQHQDDAGKANKALQTVLETLQSSISVLNQK